VAVGDDHMRVERGRGEGDAKRKEGPGKSAVTGLECCEVWSGVKKKCLEARRGGDYKASTPACTFDLSSKQSVHAPSSGQRPNALGRQVRCHCV
jgi:hypothetical protein